MMNFMKNLIRKQHNLMQIRLCSNRIDSSTYSRPLILGIETSCDDTGVAIVDQNGQVLGEAIHSQQSTHLRYGGIIPPIAQDLHRQNIENVVRKACENAKIGIDGVDAIAVTNRPGLPLSLQVGVRYAKHLGRKYSKPLIPVHHMEAHALAVRLEHKINFPFLTLLISGGHSILAFVKNYKEFYLLGETLDDAPGEALDKIARRLKMRNLPEYAWLSGGAAIEKAARQATFVDSRKYDFPLPLAQQKDCMFSFAGLKNTAVRHIQYDERTLDLETDAVIPGYREFCLGFLRGITKHLAYRTQRAIEFCEREEWFGAAVKSGQGDNDRCLVISGGVACNDFIFEAVTQMASKFGFKTLRPPKKYCTDNGVMIAWNGVEHFMNRNDVFHEFDGIEVNGKCSFGVNMMDKVSQAGIKCEWVKMDLLREKF